MAGINKSTFFLVLIVACALLITTAMAVRIYPCDEVCARTIPERVSCCQAHGYGAYVSCVNGGMDCA